ncbi:MAG TPA: LptF/LptG family permease [Gemmatimonadaceae bacterium]|jgi:lipopolysaccharide export system permease protein
MRIFRPLDRYVFSEFAKIMIVTALGFPVLLIITDLTEHLGSYLDHQIPMRDVALSYVYWLPDSMFMVLPAAVLFATVFSIGALTRHAEVIAAKASGISFYRLILPIFVGAILACGIDVVIGELSPYTNLRRSQLLREDKALLGTNRFNFVFAGSYGRVYKAFMLSADSGRMHQVQIERKGNGRSYPTYLLSADSAIYSANGAKNGQSPWTLEHGELSIVSDTGAPITISFATAHDPHFTERPREMMSKPPDPHNMRYQELTRFIQAMERSGVDASPSRVERALKLAVPFTCIIIALFGAPLATSNQRGGSAYGIAVSLATTMIFLLMIQLTKAVGSKGVIPPDLAAWVPGMLFGLLGFLLLTRVRT